METLTLRNGYQRPRSKTKPWPTLRFRNPESIEEMAQHCESHSHIWFVALDRTARIVKVNGAVRRWKRDPNRIEVPVKYGLYEYETFTGRDIGRILIPVEEEE